MATASVVKKTRLTASADIGRISLLKSCHEVRKAASYSSGGKKIRKTISGSMARSGSAGIKPITKPANTKKMGLGSFIFSIKADKLIKTANIKMTILNFSILKFSKRQDDPAGAASNYFLSGPDTKIAKKYKPRLATGLTQTVLL